jgi:hypothetical protein
MHQETYSDKSCAVVHTEFAENGTCNLANSDGGLGMTAFCVTVIQALQPLPSFDRFICATFTIWTTPIESTHMQRFCPCYQRA